MAAKSINLPIYKQKNKAVFLGSEKYHEKNLDYKNDEFFYIDVKNQKIR